MSGELEEAWAGRNIRNRGKLFTDSSGRERVIQYTVRSITGDEIAITDVGLSHIRYKHPGILEPEMAWVLVHPHLVYPDPGDSQTHLYYRLIRGRYLVVVVQCDQVMYHIVTAHYSIYLKGVATGEVRSSDFLYLAKGFRWRQKKRLKKESH